jgi:hypothetical protein
MNNGQIQVLKTYQQRNQGTPEAVFPLLCPVREHYWLDGWKAEMIYSQSGIAEENCVFTTGNVNGKEIVWTCTKYDPDKFQIHFVRVDPGKDIVKIEISLRSSEGGETTSNISYRYTSLRGGLDKSELKTLDMDFQKMMSWWEQSINHYLNTGEKLPRTPEISG